jgi:hypothetical protein
MRDRAQINNENNNQNNNANNSRTQASAVPDDLDSLCASFARLQSQLELHQRQLLALSDSFQARCHEPDPTACRFSVDDSARLVSRVDRQRALVTTTADAFRAADVGTLAELRVRSLFSAIVSVAQRKHIPALRSDAQVLRLSTADRGRFVEVRGDLLNATHVAVLVPGMTNHLGTVDALRSRADRLLLELVRQARPGERVAVVLWLGYRTPMIHEPHHVVGSSLARKGAVQLNDDLRTLVALSGGAKVTVVAHSYGTIVAGEAMKRGIPADAVVVLGSPGMNAATRRELGSPLTDLYASSVGSQPTGVIKQARSGSNAVAFAVGGVVLPILFPVTRALVDAATGRDWASSTTEVGVHGEDPANQRFGAEVFPSSGWGHDAYFDAASTGLATTATIALGRGRVATDTPKKQASV